MPRSDLTNQAPSHRCVIRCAQALPLPKTRRHRIPGRRFSYRAEAAVPQLTTLDASIAEAKRHLDQARREGDIDEIAMWRAKMDVRLERKFTQMKAAGFRG